MPDIHKYSNYIIKNRYVEIDIFLNVYYWFVSVFEYPFLE